MADKFLIMFQWKTVVSSLSFQVIFFVKLVSTLEQIAIFTTPDLKQFGINYVCDFLKRASLNNFRWKIYAKAINATLNLGI